MKTFFYLLICVATIAGCSTGSGSCDSKIKELEATFDKMRMIAEQTGSASADDYDQQKLALVRLGCLHEEALPLGLSGESRAYRVLFLHIVNMQIRYPYANMGPERRWKVWGDKQQLEQWRKLHQTYDQESFKALFEADSPVEELAKDSRFPVVSNAVVRTIKKIRFENPRKAETDLFTLFSHSPIAISITFSMIAGSEPVEQAQARALLAQMVNIRPSITNHTVQTRSQPHK